MSCVELIFKKGYYRFHIITFVHLSDVSFQWCNFRIKLFLTYFLFYDQFVFVVGSTSSHGFNVVFVRLFYTFDHHGGPLPSQHRYHRRQPV